MRRRNAPTTLIAVVTAVLALAAISTVWGTSRKRTFATPGSENRAFQPVPPEAGAYLSSKDMTTQADMIVLGRCAETRSEWFGRNLFTLATVTINEVIKGDQQSSITVALPGGIDARRKFPIAMSYVGAPTMMPNEEVFLFLTSKGQVPETHGVVGYSQGKFTIVHDEAGQKLISRHLSSPRVNSEGPTIRDAPKSIRLSDFRIQIEDYLRRR